MSFNTEVVMKDVVIVGALRTAIGCFQGALARHSAVDLGSVVVKALVERSGIAAHEVDEVILGQVLTAGAGQNPARQAALKGGLPNTVPPSPSTTSVVQD
jgi:acetyl-CoA C-acetyltransferase